MFSRSFEVTGNGGWPDLSCRESLSKGITGFGNAIINLLVWFTFSAAGVNAGPLQLAVLADSIGCVVCSIPLLLMTSAHKTADWRLVVTLVLFTAAGAPLGAELLTHLPVRWVELVMAVVLLLVICLHVKLHETLAQALRNWRAQRRLGACKGLLDDEVHKAAGRSDGERSGDKAALVHDGGAGSNGGLGTTTGEDTAEAEAVLRSVAVDCVPSALRSCGPSTQTADQLSCARKHGTGIQCVSAPSSAPPSASAAGADAAARPAAPLAGLHSGGPALNTCLCSNLKPAPIDPDLLPCDSADVAAGKASMYSGPAAVPLNGLQGLRPAATAADDLASAGPAPFEEDTYLRGAADVCSCASTHTDTAAASAKDDEEGVLLKPAPPSEGASSTASTDTSSAMSDMQPLLSRGARTSDGVSERQAGRLYGSRADDPGSGQAAHLAVDDGDFDGCHGVRRFSSRRGAGILAWLRRWAAQHGWQEMRRILMFSSAAGFASGVMGGMTGIGGPPIMFMYEKLKVTKEVVRGTNAVGNVLQVRLVSYIIMGVLKRQDALLYAITSSIGLVGVFVGNALAGRLDQRAFSRVLVALMVICCVLLFVSAAGLKSRATP